MPSCVALKLWTVVEEYFEGRCLFAALAILSTKEVAVLPQDMLLELHHISKSSQCPHAETHFDTSVDEER